MSMPDALGEALQQLAAEHPGAHPFTLALLLQARTGRTLSGAQVAQVLRGVKGPPPIPIQIATK